MIDARSSLGRSLDSYDVHPVDAFKDCMNMSNTPRKGGRVSILADHITYHLDESGWV